jgi:O-phospho-L-seryl-tRNASec:L-selenocysteinyl-tRNA synthase
MESPAPPAKPEADASKPSNDETAESQKGGRSSSSSSSSSSASSTSSFLDTKMVNSLSHLLEVPASHLAVGVAGRWAQSDKEWRVLVTHRQVPTHGWSDAQIQRVLLNLSCLDTSSERSSSSQSFNAKGAWCGVGEREGRCYSSLVRNRHFGLSHGIGRSGDIQEAQPKAVGSTIVARLALGMALDAVRRGSRLDASSSAQHGMVLPLCTGMSMALVLQSLRTAHPTENTRNVVLWSRIDQKSCFKAITTAGFECVVVPTKTVNDQVQTDLDALNAALQQYENRVLAVLTTTSCFAPRVADSVDAVAKTCLKRSVAHVINHAYGLQCRTTNKLVNRACAVGRVDAIICSTDKNFLVPVGTSLHINRIANASKGSHALTLIN